MTNQTVTAAVDDIIDILNDVSPSNGFKILSAVLVAYIQQSVSYKKEKTTLFKIAMDAKASLKGPAASNT